MNSVQKLFLKTILVLITLVILIGRAQAQDQCPPMPPGLICIDRAVALKALEDSDARKALEAEKVQLNQAIEDMRKALNDMRIEFARTSGELTAVKQIQVRDAAIIEMLLQNVKKKRTALITLF